MPTLYIVGIVIAVIIFLCIFVTVCYKKAPPTEAIVITGLGHREPKLQQRTPSGKYCPQKKTSNRSSNHLCGNKGFSFRFFQQARP